MRGRKHPREVADGVEQRGHGDAADVIDGARVGARVHGDVAEAARAAAPGIEDMDVAAFAEQRDAMEHGGRLEVQRALRVIARECVDAQGVALPRFQSGDGKGVGVDAMAHAHMAAG